MTSTNTSASAEPPTSPRRWAPCVDVTELELTHLLLTIAQHVITPWTSTMDQHEPTR